MSRQDLTSSNHQKANFGELSTLAQVRKFVLNLQGFHKVTLQVVSRNHKVIRKSPLIQGASSLSNLSYRRC